MSAELVLIFSDSGIGKVVPRLSAEYDRYSTASDAKRSPTMIIVSKATFKKLEKEWESDKFPDVPVPDGAYPCLRFRGRPLVAIDGNNLISARIDEQEKK